MEIWGYHKNSIIIPKFYGKNYWIYSNKLINHMLHTGL